MAPVQFSFASSNKRSNYNAAAGGRRVNGRTTAFLPYAHGALGTHTHTPHSNMAPTICLPLTSRGAFLKKESGCSRKPNTRLKKTPYYSHPNRPETDTAILSDNKNSHTLEITKIMGKKGPLFCGREWMKHILTARRPTKR